MALNYRDLQTREVDLVKQLHYLDCFLPEGFRDPGQDYPQLFDSNEDSLFSPDAMFGGGSTSPLTAYNNLPKPSGQDKQMFEEYLDSLELNQFMKLQCEYDKSQGNGGNKSLKNLESSLQCTFKPSILKKSNQIAGTLQPSFERLTTNPTQSQKKKIPYQPQDKLMKKTYSRQRIERLSKPRIMKTEPSQAIEAKKDSKQKKPYIQRNSYGMDVASRNQLWQEQKNQKIQKLRQEEEANRLRKESSTFVPKTTQYKGEREANISQFGKQGMANYFQRVNMAKHKNPKQIASSSFVKENTYSQRRESVSPYASTKQLPRTPGRELTNTQGKQRNHQGQSHQRVKYEDAVKQLHKKLMSLKI